jgi:2-polyprenyl-6-methoxyphenol hydroxylase-like FAD-dependent oxidoreductase
MTGVSDVVIVGGGVSGASLAYALASAGLGVTVLEASTKYEDRVRGESMAPWGVQEARNLGVEQILLDAGGIVSPLWKQYLEGLGEVEIPMAMMVPGIPGSLNLRHPIACQALIDAAAGAGATVMRGVRDVRLTPGRSVGVSFATDVDHELTAGLVVGADGRASVVRKQTAITLERQEPISYIAGLLVDGLQDMPDQDVMVGDGDLFFLLFHQGGGRARVYLCGGLSGLHRFAGRDRAGKFLAACRLPSYPWADVVAGATAAGPCATYAGDDTWTATPYAQGVVLIGDAAGHNDPVIGQGLSIGLRDARVVRDLIVDGARHPADFAPYGEERLGRMERLRLVADVIAVTQAEDADNRPARRAFFTEKMSSMDPQILPLVVGSFAGPETIPPDLVNPRVLDRIRTAEGRSVAPRRRAGARFPRLRRRTPAAAEGR